jgi:two-component system CheB/CheR fusion protein
MSPQESPDPQFEALLDFLRISRGFDFTGYKRSSLMRRVLKRRYALSQASFGDYLDYLQVHPDEFEHLFNTILINVTSFFRDKPAWDYLRSRSCRVSCSTKKRGSPSGCGALAAPREKKPTPWRWSSQIIWVRKLFTSG